LNLHYTFTPTIVRDLMAIEAARQEVRFTVLPPQADGWLEVADPARKSRRYRLSARFAYRHAMRIGGLSAM
jgi:hypothetical protein